MTRASQITSKLAQPGNAASLSAQARQRRWSLFVDSFPMISDMHVLDLGGTRAYWEAAPERPASVTAINLPTAFNGDDCPQWFRPVVDDACGELASLSDQRFDLVVSNSVLEHVGGPARRAAFARNVRRLGDRAWVQTPYRYFPVEPHWLCPGFQFFPLRTRVWLTKKWPLGHRHASSDEDALEQVLEVELIARTEMRHLFPDAQIVSERFGPFVKSLIAIRR